MVKIIPQTESIFWIISAAGFFLGIILYLLSPVKEEPGYRSPLPVLYKWIIITGVIFILVVIKKYLHGFMTLFPMVGIVAVYEMRFSLWTLCRNIPLIMILISPLLMVCRLTQEKTGLAIGLLLGWIVMALVAVPVYIFLWNRTYPDISEDQ